LTSSSSRRSRAHALPDDAADGIAVVTDNEMHDPVFPTAAPSARSKDPQTGAVAITRYAASTMWAAASIR
jgi:hypothetical protein